jgi:hypothetical protein
MVIKHYYFPNILRKLNLSLINLFSGIQVAKKDISGNIVEYRQVPIRFVHKQKFIPLLTEDGEANRMWFNQHLPMMALFIKGISYDPTKTRGGFDAPIFSYVDQNDATKKIFSGTPYKISYSLGILSMHMSEMSMIIEQILPQFNPYHNITIKEWDFLPELTRDIKVLINSNIETNFDNELPEEKFKKIEFEISFDASCNFYQPIPITTLVKYVSFNLKDNTMTDSPSAYDSYIYDVSGNDATNYIVTANEWLNIGY